MLNKIDFEKIFSELGNQIDSASKEVILKNRELLESMGASGLQRLMDSISEEDGAEVNAILQEKLMMSLSDQDLLHLKLQNIESTRALARINDQRKQVAKDLIHKISQGAAQALIKAIV